MSLYSLFYPSFRYPFSLVDLVGCPCLTLFLLPSVFPVCVKFSQPSFLTICPRNFNCVFLIPNIKVLFVSISLLRCLRTSSVVFSASYWRTTFVTLSLLFMKWLSRIYCHRRGLIFQSSSLLFPWFLKKFSCTLLISIRICFSLPNEGLQIRFFLNYTRLNLKYNLTKNMLWKQFRISCN